MGCNCDVKNFTVGAGETFAPVVRWAMKTLTTVAISGIARATPVLITAVGHGIPQGWPVAVVGVTGMPEINATRYPPVANDFHYATVADANTITLNDISSAQFQPYSSGGSIVYNTPQPLVGVVPTMTFYDTPQKDTVLATLTLGSGLTVDTIQMLMVPELQTAGLLWDTAYYDLDVVDANAVVTRILTGILTIN